MTIYLAKVSKAGKVGLVPTDAESQAAIEKLGDGEVVTCSIVKPRSSQWHRLYFGLCRMVGENQEPARDESSIDYELRVLAGHYDAMKVRKGNELYEVRVPKRIAFDKLTAEEWQALWPSLSLALCERFGSEYMESVPGWAT